MNKAREFCSKASTRALLVLFVFVILLVSLFIAALTGRILAVLNVIELQVFLVEGGVRAFFVLHSVNLLFGTCLTIIGAKYFLAPLNRLTLATKEIAKGNFNVRVEAKGSNELVRLTTSFNKMAKELGSIETLRTDFVSNISHEFKTPVASIRGFAKRLLKNNITEEQRIKYLNIIVAESERLARLSSNVLLLSNLENYDNEQETKVTYPLDEQLRRVILLLEPQLDKKSLEIDIDLESAEIEANEELMYHVWLNILGNAIKFSDTNGVIQIKLKKMDNKVEVCIADAGQGMSEEIKNRMFEKFYQGDESRGLEGNGLGLSLVKRILDIENGNIQVFSEIGKGTQIKILI